MSFTSPGALWLLLLCLLPLLLSRRRSSVRYQISNLFLWRDAAPLTAGRVPRVRLQLTPLVLVQSACIALIVLSLAGPAIRAKGGRTAIVFDLSASMAARDGEATRFSAARARARSMVEELPRFASVRLIAATAFPHQLGEWTVSDPRLLAAIDALQPTAGTADIPAAIEIATAPGDVNNIVVFSDRSLADPGGAVASQPVQLVRIGGRVENAAVTRVAARRTELGGPNGQVLVVLRNYGTAPRDAEVEIEIDGRVVHRGHVQLAATASQTMTVALGDLGQFVTARLIGADALQLDDVRSIAMPRASAIRVVLAGPGGSFLEHALAVHPSVALRTYSQQMPWREIKTSQTFDVFVCDRCSDSPVTDVPALVVFDSGERTHDAVRVVATGHPLAESLDPGAATATAGSRGTADPRSEVVLRVGGVAAVTALDANDQRRIDVHLDLTEPGFVLSPAFPVLVANSIAWLAQRQAPPQELVAGEPLTFSAAASGDAVRVVGPDGRGRDVQRAGGRFLVTDTEATGRYHVRVNASDYAVAVNPDAAESDLSGANREEVGAGGTSTTALRAPVALARWLALLTIVLLGLEWRLRMQGAS